MSAAGVYPSRLSATGHFVTMITRAPFLCAVATHAIFPFYLKLISRLKWSDAAVFTLVVSATHSLTYIACNTVYSLFDAKKWLQRFKLPRKKSQEPSSQLMKATLIQAAVGQMISPMFAFCMHRYVVAGMPAQDAPIPSLLKCWFHFAMATIVNEVGFYTAHRILHEYPYLYQKIHKQHHKYIGTVSIAAEYAALPEEILAATIPTMGYLAAVKAPTPIFAVWMLCRLFETYESHSGYCFRDCFLAKWFGLLNGERAEFHDYHHTANTGNYGTNVFLDYMFGTMTPYLESKARQQKQEQQQQQESS